MCWKSKKYPTTSHPLLPVTFTPHPQNLFLPPSLALSTGAVIWFERDESLSIRFGKGCTFPPLWNNPWE